MNQLFLKKLFVISFMTMTMCANSKPHHLFPSINKPLYEMPGNYTQEAFLIGSGNAGGALQGTALSFTADGTYLAVGSNIQTDEDTGAVWIFQKHGNYWSQLQYITASNEIGNAGFGASVSFSADGSTLAVGGPLDILQKIIVSKV